MNRRGHKREKIIELLVSKPDMTIKEISELCGVTKNYANVIIQGYKAAKSNESPFEQSLPFEETFDGHMYQKISKLNEEIEELKKDNLAYQAVIGYLEYKLEQTLADAV
jgi:DNA-binding transcriptional MerR regulator